MNGTPADDSRTLILERHLHDASGAYHLYQLIVKTVDNDYDFDRLQREYKQFYNSPLYRPMGEFCNNDPNTP